MKKILSVILAAIMILSIATVAFAATPTITTTVDKTSVVAGDVVTLTATVSANSNLCALTYQITYDTSAFSIVESSASTGGAFSSESYNTTSGLIKYLGASANGISGASKTMFTVKFKALKSSGTISVAVTEAYTANGVNENNVTSSVNSASAKTFTFSPSTSSSYISIRKPSRSTIRCKDGIILHVDDVKSYSSSYKIQWSASNSNFETTTLDDGKSLKIVSKSNGDTEFTATLCNASGSPIDTVSVTMTSKAGFFDKIGGFFRGLFGLTTIYAE